MLTPTNKQTDLRGHCNNTTVVNIERFDTVDCYENANTVSYS